MTQKEGNPVRMLFTLYFMPCDIMHQHHRRLKAKFFAVGEQEKTKVFGEFLTFTLYWLAGLFVVIEGWRALKIVDPKIDKMIDEHWDSLRLFRNGVFHFQPEDRKHKQFIDMEKFNWAEQLHSDLSAFFVTQEHMVG